MENIDKLYNEIIDNGIATENELNLVTSINGYNEETLNNVIYARTGYHDIQQFLGYEG